MENNDEVGQSFLLDKEDEESMEESSVSSEEDETQEECVDHPSEEEQLFSKSLTSTQETRSDPDSVQNGSITFPPLNRTISPLITTNHPLFFYNNSSFTR